VIYLQYFEKLIAKGWMETGEITYYRRYVHDIIIIFDQNKINENLITNYLNNIHKYLELKLTAEENKNTSLPDGNKNNPQMRIYIKPTQTDTTIHFTSNHPL
jgi:hypothetical protein